MADLAVLGIKVDSTQIVKAEKALDGLTASAKKTETATGKLDTTTKKATGSVAGLGTSVKTTRRATDDLAASANKNKTATTGMANAWKNAKTFMIGFIGVRAIQFFKELSDEAIKIENLLKQVTSSQKELNVTFDALGIVANESRTSLLATTQLYQRLAIVSGDLNLTSSELIDITSTITKSFTLSGATANEAAGAIRQLSQGLAAGALRGDEFNSVAEQAPMIMRAIAKETGLSIGALREFAATGGITAEIVVNSIQAMEQEVNEAFSGTTATFSQQMEVIRNELVIWASENDNVGESMNLLGGIIKVVAEIVVVFADILFAAVSGISQLITLGYDLSRSMGRSESAFDDLNKPVSEFLDFEGLIIDGLSALATGFLYIAQVIFAGPVLAFNIITTAIKVFYNGILDAGIAILEFTGVNDDLLQNLKNAKISFETITAKNKAYAASFEKGRQEIEKFRTAGRGATDDVLDLEFVMSELDSTLGDIESSFTDADVDSFSNGVDDLITSTDLANTGLAIFDESIGDVVGSLDSMNERYTDWNVLIKNAEQGQKDLGREGKKAARDMEREYDIAFNTTADLLFDFFRNGETGFSEFADNVLDTIKDLLANMAAEWAASKVLGWLGITPTTGTSGGGIIGTLLGGGGGSGGGNSISDVVTGGAGLDSAGGIVDALGSASDTLLDVVDGLQSGGLSGGIDVISDIISDGFDSITDVFADPTLTNSITGEALAGPVQPSGVTQAIDAAANIAVAFIGNKLGDAIVGFTGGKTAQSDIGASIGASIGSVLLPGIGTLVGSTLGTLLDSAFGTTSAGPKSRFGTDLDLGDKTRTLDDFDVGAAFESVFGDFQFSTTRDLFANQADADAVLGSIDNLVAIENELGALLDPTEISAVSAALGEFRVNTEDGVDVIGFFAGRFTTILEAIGGDLGAAFGGLAAEARFVKDTFAGIGGEGGGLSPVTGMNNDLFNQQILQAAFDAISGEPAPAAGSFLPGFASGGFHTGGLRIVGENGPELEATGASRIFSSGQLSSMMGGGGGAAEEIKQLRGEVAKANVASIDALTSVKIILQRWNSDQLPSFREIQTVRTI
tara:strand:- start:18039 stop:21287 length:3249 start_codon:yes stop_codon:yes gene_type:complete